jgi:hypothetical protein
MSPSVALNSMISLAVAIWALWPVGGHASYAAARGDSPRLSPAAASAAAAAASTAISTRCFVQIRCVWIDI